MADSDIVMTIGASTELLKQQLKQVGIDVKSFSADVGKDSGVANDGMILLSESAQIAARDMGLPGPVARKLGTSVENLIMSFGKFAVGVGVATIAVAAAVAIYQKFVAAQKEHRQELESSVSGMRGEVEALYNTAGASRQAQQATYNLTMAKRDLLRVELQQLITAENKAMQEQEEILAKSGTMFKKAWDNFTSLAAWTGNTDKALQERNDYLARLTGQIDLSKAKLNEWKAVLDRISGKAPSFEETKYKESDRLQNEIDREKSLYDLRKAQGVSSMQDHMDTELRLFDMMHAKKLSTLVASAATERQIEDELAIYKNQREALSLNLTHAKDQKEWSSAQTMYGGMSQLAERFYNVTGGRAKAFFFLSRGLAAAEAFCHYWAASSRASKDQNEGMATYYKVMAVATPALILAEAFSGTNGGSAGASAPSGGSNTSGLPTVQDQSQVINISINGQPTDVPGLAERLVKEIGRNNGSVGGYTVTMEATA